MTNVPEAKNELRRQMRRVRSGIDNREMRSAALWANVLHECRRATLQLPSTRAGERLSVLAFAGVGSEPDTTRLVGLLQAAGYSPLLPRVHGQEMMAVRTTADESLRPGAFGIPEPTGPVAEPSEIDIVLVPGLAFTQDGRRLGQGGGYYDRFLPLLRSDCLTFGVAFHEQVVDELPTEQHDRILGGLITDVVPE